ncbi:DUF982 domain-containing protein [Labrys portucalensis]|uniref:DUF982 domain-containing protein n=1 Tax=Labrys neptuniae TaxID=376174 RepID=A0ABV6Z8M0_9HYPH
MDPKPFSSPVRFETGIGQFRIVATTQEAARVLLMNWPFDEGEAYFAARQACLDALEGEIPAEMARAAFVEACDEAGMYVMQ